MEKEILKMEFQGSIDEMEELLNRKGWKRKKVSLYEKDSWYRGLQKKLRRKVDIINCCDHEVVVRGNDGSDITFSPSKYHTRFRSKAFPTMTDVGSVPILYLDPSETLMDEPPVKENTLYIVSHIVFDRTNRLDFLKPDTSKYANGADRVILLTGNGHCMTKVRRVNRLIGRYNDTCDKEMRLRN